MVVTRLPPLILGIEDSKFNLASLSCFFYVKSGQNQADFSCLVLNTGI